MLRCQIWSGFGNIEKKNHFYQKRFLLKKVFKGLQNEVQYNCIIDLNTFLRINKICKIWQRSIVSQ